MKKGSVVGLLVGILLLVAGNSYATLIFENDLNNSSSDAGGFSQANQILAGEFSVNTSATVNQAKWYGTMHSGDPLDTGDTWNFDVTFRGENSDQPSSILSNTSVVASVTETAYTVESQRVYMFDALFSNFTLSANTSYFFTALNTGTQNTFRWTVGLDTSYDAFFSNDSGSTWADLSNRSPLNFSLHNTGASSVPEPATMLLFGLGLLGLAGVNRRKK